MMNKHEYIEKQKNNHHMKEMVAKDKNRLSYHLMPPTGWLNDPNGLCQFNGIYHIYYQYSPFDTGWGTKLWGHYTTKDWIHFKSEDPFLFPDQRIDRDGVYSGSAFVHHNKIHYFYTGNVKLLDQDYDYINEGREQNTIYFNSEDGYHISSKELLLNNNDYGINMSKHVQNPKIFEKDGVFYMVLGARTKDSIGCVLMYRSTDLKNWQYFNTITTPTPFGYMWECPDLFEIGGQLFLMVCPQGVKQIGYQYENVYQCGYFKLDFNFTENTYTIGEFVELDHGFDIYAPQSFSDEKNRRILIGWFGIPDATYHNDVTCQYEWQHALTLPRQVTNKDGYLCFYPIEETKALRQEGFECLIQELNQQNIETICYEMNIQFDHNQSFNLNIRDDVSLNYDNGLLTLTMYESGCGRNQRHIEIDNLLNMTIFSDTSALEIYINDGRYVMSSRVYSQSFKQVPHFNHDDLIGSIHFYPLKGYEID